MRTTPSRTVLIVLALVCFAFGGLTGAWAQEGGTKYVAVGDSLTAGFMSGGLAEQYDSFPALFYTQLMGTSNGFEQPIVTLPGIPSQLELHGLFPTVLEPGEGDAIPINALLPRPYDNLGVPGARVEDALETTTGGIYDLILRNPSLGNTTMVQQAMMLQATIMTVWLGSNDALGAATAGNPAYLTDLDDFEEYYQELLETLASSGASLIVANIPDVTTIPFVNTIPPILVDPATNQPVLIEGNMVPLIGPDGATPLTFADKPLLTAAGYMGIGCGIPMALGGVAGAPHGTQPACPTGGLPDNAVLLADQLAEIAAAVIDFNAVIAATVSSVGAVLVDTNAAMTDVAAHGVNIGGLDYDAGFLTGGFFSYDGVHPTDLGYAYTTNLFIAAANEAYELNMAPVDLYPFVFGSGAQASRLPEYMAKGAILGSNAINNIVATAGVKDLLIDLPVVSTRPRGRLPRVLPRPRGEQPRGIRPIRRSTPINRLR